ncbi:DNA-binding protein [Stenotrophomonas sp. SMYL41]|uniref:DNA-binding protein n=1 Tax=Stenotrophomonas sp. SMYL41 TaxID=3076047 RepID=UPI002E76D98B|nr:DNA-binding protein [Stenotrophomonas sp. SMYL41]
MAKGISELDVHQAADDIIAAGERPTVERIRAHLGTGSPNTVTRWLETWWQTVGLRLRQRAIEAAVPGIPERLAHLSHRLWQAALQDAGELAQTQLDSARHALDERERLLEGERATLALAIEASQKREREAQVQTQSAVATAEQLSAQVSQLTAQVQDLLRQRDGAYGRAERLEQELDAVRRSLGEATTAHEGERRALQAHVIAVEDRAHTEVDRHRQALRSAEQEWGRERIALTTSLRESEQQAIVTANREQQALRRLEGVTARADGLEAQLTSLKETTRRVTEALRLRRADTAPTSKQSKQRRTAPKRESAL